MRRAVAIILAAALAFGIPAALGRHHQPARYPGPAPGTSGRP